MRKIIHRIVRHSLIHYTIKMVTLLFFMPILYLRHDAVYFPALHEKHEQVFLHFCNRLHVSFDRYRLHCYGIDCVAQLIMTSIGIFKNSTIFDGDTSTSRMSAGGSLLGCLPPPLQGQKVNVTGIPTPESKSKHITYRYRQKKPKDFFPAHVWSTFIS